MTHSNYIAGTMLGTRKVHFSAHGVALNFQSSPDGKRCSVYFWDEGTNRWEYSGETYEQFPIPRQRMFSLCESVYKLFSSQQWA